MYPLNCLINLIWITDRDIFRRGFGNFFFRHYYILKLNSFRCFNDFFFHICNNLHLTFCWNSIRQASTKLFFLRSSCYQSYVANSLATAISEHALYRLPTFHVPNLMSLFHCLVCIKGSDLEICKYSLYKTLLITKQWGPKHVELTQVLDKLTQWNTLCILLDCIYITRWCTVPTVSNQAEV